MNPTIDRMNGSIDRLYELMPALYREQDAEAGHALRALLRIIERHAAMIDSDIEGLWDDLFIETCAPWVIPYIGDLVSNDLLFDATRLGGPDTAERLFRDLVGTDLRPPVAARVRADVAKTIYYRRRKGTLPMLEELARDVTGWPAHAVEFFELLGWTQMLEHIRLQSRWTDVRPVEAMERIDGPFDEASHTVDVRRIAQDEGWHNVRTVGFFLWRLRGYPYHDVPARRADRPWRFHVSPLGNPAPLFSRWRREGDEAGLATELHVPAPIRPTLFQADLERYRDAESPRADSTDLYGLFEPAPASPLAPNPQASLAVFRNDEPVAPAADPTAPPSTYEAQIVCRRLDPWPANPPSGRLIAVDVENGRLAVGDGWPDATRRVDVWFHHGFPADLGGGPYDRRTWLIDPALGSLGRRLWVSERGAFPATAAPGDSFASVTDALADWASPTAGPARPNALVTILDSRTYPLPTAVTIPSDGWLALEATNGARPVLQTRDAATPLEVQVDPPAAPGDQSQAALTLSGVVLEGSVHVTGDLGRLRLLHTTLVPGRRLQGDGEPETADPSVIVEGGTEADPINALLEVEAAFSICGPVVVPEHGAGVTLLDCIVDGLGATALTVPALTVERTTVLGTTEAVRLDASECIFTGLVSTDRTQDGCVRFSYVRPGSRTPRRYRCQPDVAVAAAVEDAEDRDPALSEAERAAIRQHVEAWLVPAFTTTRYGRPAFAQIRLTTPQEIRTGAEDGSEMGAYCHVRQPQRESNLRIRLDEYLPFGLEAGAIYVT